MNDLKTFHDIKDYLKTLKIIYTSDYPQERTVREAISELSKEGIIFILVQSVKVSMYQSKVQVKMK